MNISLLRVNMCKNNIIIHYFKLNFIFTMFHILHNQALVKELYE